MTSKTERTVKSYTGLRKDVINMITTAPIRVLDIGCSDGSLGVALKEVYGSVDVHGIEFDPSFVQTARSRLATVMQADLNNFDPSSLPQNVDLFIFADVLEHTMQPKEVLEKILSHCATDNAKIIISVPNVQHITVIRNLFFGVWPERDRGIFDRTHLRWFTLQTLQELAEAVGCKVTRLERRYRLLDRPDGKINRYAKWFIYLPLKNFFTYQYIILLSRNP
jgi:2-polyprenyl-3-methyl-5-hydroxy-6-metoxy-1,4-benzoquinol methylase